ncbi:sodium:solute symporter family protein [Streptomyces tubercidicus]|uniref:sodium:solute symporter family protein n=1 Tax=Streptomyces tubercidicus TaxID=47759 RepID=UPI003467B7B5
MAIAVFCIIVAASLVIAVAARRGSGRGDVSHFLVGGRSFNGVLLFFLSVGEVYSIATLLGFPAGIYSQGAGYGVWFIGYILLAYPIGYYVGPLMWRAAKRYDAMTVPDVMRARFGSRALEITVALATVTYLLTYAQFQFAGLHAALAALGFHLTPEITVVITVAISLVYVTLTGIKAPAMVSVLKDIALIVAVGLVGLFAISGLSESGAGPGALFDAAREAGSPATLTGEPLVQALTTMVVQSLGFYLGTMGLAFVVAGRSERTVRRTIVIQPLYMLMYPLLVFASYYSLAHLKLADPNRAFPAAAQATGADWLVGLTAGAAALTGLLSVSVLALGFGGVLSRNLLPAADPARQRRWVSVSTAGYLVISAVLAVTVQALMLDVLAFAYVIGSQVVPAWLVTLFSRRITAPAVLTGLIVGLVVGVALQASGHPVVHGVNGGLIALTVNLAITFGSGLFLARRTPAPAAEPALT